MYILHCNQNVRRVLEGSLPPHLPRDIAMIKTVVLAATVLLAAAPAAASAEAFKHKGVEYNYTTENEAGEQVLRGTAYSGKVPFELHVRKKSVEGTFNNKPVSFSLADAKKAGLIVDAK